MSIYEPDDKIYQTNPPISNNSNYKLKTWTDTVNGYIYEAKKLTYCLKQNKVLTRKQYSWFVTINFHQKIELQKIKKFFDDHWIKNCRKLKNKGLIAFWSTEPNKKNKIHIHLIILSNQTKKELSQIFEDCLPSRKSVEGWHKRIDPISNDYRLLHYVTKGKIAGKTKKGMEVEDLYKNKRLLFKKRLGFKKHGTIGSFWFKPIKKILEDQRLKESKIAYGMGDKDIMCLRDYICEGVIGRNYDNETKTEIFYTKPLSIENPKNIARNLAYKHDCPDQKKLINNLKAEKNIFFEDSENKYGHLRNHRISEGLQNKDIVIFAHYLYETLYKRNWFSKKNRYYLLRDVQELVAYNHESSAYKDWISRIKLEDPTYFEKDAEDCYFGYTIDYDCSMSYRSIIRK
jgi:hypothetical protein